MLEPGQLVLPGPTAGYVAKSAGYTVAATDRGYLIDCTGSFTLALTAAATLGSGFSFYARNVSGTQTIDPNAAETVNGAATYAVSNAKDVVLVVCDGTNWVLTHMQLPAGIAVTGGTIDGTTIGVSTPAAGNFTTIGATTRGSILATTIGANGIASFTNATASTSTSTGAVVVTGGAGIGGAAWIGGLLNVGGSLTVAALTTGRVPFASTAGLLVDAGSFTYSATAGLISQAAISDPAAAASAQSVQQVVTLTADNANNGFGIKSSMRIAGNFNCTGFVEGFDNTVRTDITTGKTLSNLVGVLHTIWNNGAGSVTNTYGSYTQFLGSNLGTVYAHYAPAMSGGSTHYLLYGAGAGKVFVGDSTASTTTATGCAVFSGGIGIAGDIFGGGIINAATAHKTAGTQVVGARDTGWTAMTGSPDKATAYATGSVTLVQLAGRVAQLQASLTTHGLIGT